MGGFRLNRFQNVDKRDILNLFLLIYRTGMDGRSIYFYTDY